MPSDIFWLAALELPDDTVSAFIDTDRLRTEDAIDRFTKLNPAIRPALFKLKYVGGKLLVKKVVGRSGLRKPRELPLERPEIHL